VDEPVDDLGTRLAEAAELAAQHARPPGAAAILRRARARRRWAAATALGVVVTVAAAGIGLQRVGFELPAADRGADRWTDRWQDKPWRPLVASEWRASVPDERPLDPVLVATRGEQAGQPWRLVVYRSVHRPEGQAAQTDVCYILDWIALSQERQEKQESWQAHGSCAAQDTTATVLAVGGPVDREQLTAVVGRAPAAATRVRLELRGRPPVETATVATGASLLGRFYVAFVPRAAYLERMVALDDDGRQVGEAPGQGDLAREVMGFPPTGPVEVVARDPSTAEGALEVTAWPTRYGFCVALRSQRGGGSSSCDTPQSGERAIDPQLGCGSSGSPGRPTVIQASAAGGVPRATRTVRVEVAGKRFEVPARDAGEPFDRAFFVTDLPTAKQKLTARFVALDAQGATVTTWRWSYRCG
jgi:hypothetical protein